jgi:hypothetical protein
MGGLYLQGLQDMMDSQQRFMRAGLEVFLRAQNFAPEGNFEEVGVGYTPANVGADQSGFTDILIDPPPEVKAVGSDNKGLDAARMQFGTKLFRISQTFVQNMMQMYPTILDPYNVFRQWDGGTNQTGPQTTSVVGIVYADRLYSIEKIDRDSAGGRTLLWRITATYHENELPTSAGEIVQPT